MKARLLVLLLPLILVPEMASACSVCMGDPNSYLAAASNSVFCMLLGLVGFIFLATGATAFYLWQRSKAVIPPHIELVETMARETDDSQD